MKFKTLILIIIAVFAVQIAGAVLFLTADVQPRTQDLSEINDILQDCTANFDSIEHVSTSYSYDFSVINRNGDLLFYTKNELSNSINQAIQNRDTILDIVINGDIAGKLIIESNYSSAIQSKNLQLTIFTIIMLIIMAMTLIFYIVYINKRVIKPFNRLNRFATAIASGDLETQLNMDKQNIFGAFTESFDIMRTELNNARIAEHKATESKKLLIANLSHDIKTPIASIKALAEVGEVKSEKKDKRTFVMINKKADQVNELVGNLFSAALEEMNQLIINISDYDSNILKDIISSADYLGMAKIGEVPEMLLGIDKQRLQQVVDNIISNSYKYAGTEIQIAFSQNDKFLRMIIKDFGGYEDSPEKLLSKFYRGSNALGKDGTGLGLYISKYLMTAMGGDLTLDTSKNCFMVMLDIKIS